MTRMIAGLRRPPKRSILLLVALVPLVFLLTACVSIQSDITLYRGEEWSAQIRMTVAQSVISWGGPTLDGEMQSMTAEMRRLGIDWTWRKELKESDTIYHVSAKGKGWDNLNQATQRLMGYGGATVTRIDGGHLSFQYTTAGSSWSGGAHTLRLTGGKIISSNADEVKGNTAIWYNLQSQYGSGGDALAVLTEATRTPIPCPAGLGLVLLVMPVGLYAHTHARR